MSLLWPTLRLAHTLPNEERMRKPSDRHGYSDRENPTYLEQWCNSYSKDTDLGSVLIYVTTVPWVNRDSAGGEWDIDRRCSNGYKAIVPDYQYTQPRLAHADGTCT